jgi:hypothetical protein
LFPKVETQQVDPIYPLKMPGAAAFVFKAVFDFSAPFEPLTNPS